jgi:hypothetical protein
VVSMYFPPESRSVLSVLQIASVFVQELSRSAGSSLFALSRCKNRCFGASFADTRMARAVASSCG